jgi:DNA-binding CsgD family transcriptional regulator
LVINAVVLWGGAFPFLPIEAQTQEATAAFYLLQSSAFGMTFLVGMFAARVLSRLTRLMLVLVSVTPILAGSSCLIMARHLPSLSMTLTCMGALLLGVGCASLFVLWQRSFSSLPPTKGIRSLVVGALLAVPLYLGLCLVPRVVMSLLIPLVLAPLCGLAISSCVGRAGRLQSTPGEASRPTGGEALDDRVSDGGASGDEVPGIGASGESRLSKQHTLLRQRYLLSARELEIVELVARGNSVASIARRLVITENTVRTHMKRIYNKLAVHKRQELLDLLELLELLE